METDAEPETQLEKSVETDLWTVSVDENRGLQIEPDFGSEQPVQGDPGIASVDQTRGLVRRHVAAVG